MNASIKLEFGDDGKIRQVISGTFDEVVRLLETAVLTDDALYVLVDTAMSSFELQQKYK